VERNGREASCSLVALLMTSCKKNASRARSGVQDVNKVNTPFIGLGHGDKLAFMDDKVENGQHVALEQLLADIKLVLRDGQELLRLGVSNVRERARTGAETTDRFVKERPYQTLGLAFGMGVLIGLLASSALSRHGLEFDDD